MNKQISCSHVIATILGIVFVTFFISSNAYAARFEPVPFNNIPSAIIKSEDKDYVFTADYSVDFGGETRIEHDDDAELASNMKLDKDDGLSLEVECNSNDICDDSLSPPIQDCANFDFDIPEDVLTKKYKIVVDMVYDEAEWIFINPVRILN